MGAHAFVSAAGPTAAPAETFSATSRSYDSAAAETDHQYLLVGAWWDAQQNGQPSYLPLELLAFDDGVVGRGSAGCQPRQADKDSGRAALWGQGETSVVDVLNRTPADPEASKFMALGPDERWQRVAADRKSETPGSPRQQGLALRAFLPTIFKLARPLTADAGLDIIPRER